MNKQELIKYFDELPYVSITQMGKKSFIDLIEQLDEPLPFKLKDVVGRIRGFDQITQAIWLNTILKELGNDYGLMKYRSGYDQGLLDGAFVGNQLKDADKIRQELNKPVIPQFVAEYIKWAKKEDFHLLGAMNRENFDKKLDDWFYTDDNIEVFARAWLDGYETKEEKRYRVKFKGVSSDEEYLTKKFGGIWGFTEGEEDEEYRTKHTRKELEEAGFGWVFDCPGIEIEEVE